MEALTPQENEKLFPLFLAIFFNDVEKVKEFKLLHPELYSKKSFFLLKDQYIYAEQPQPLIFNLVNLTQLNHFFWNPAENWVERVKPLVAKHQKKVKQMLDYWHDEFGTDPIFDEIIYNHYHEYFYCDDPSDYELVCADPMSHFLKLGFNELDLRLYNRVESFDFEETIKLLNQGAKVNIPIEENNYFSTIMGRIDSEFSYYVYECILPTFENHENTAYAQNLYSNASRVNVVEMFGDLLGSVAHEKMLCILKRFQ